MTALFMIVTPEGGAIYDRHVAEGLVVCEKHLRELRYFFDPTAREIGENEMLIHRGCGMCQTMHVEGNLCESCKAPLHPQWPAVYCSNRCALDDL